MPRSSSSAARRTSYSEGAQVRGDRSRRVAVPLPSRVQDLESHATRHFGYDRSTLRLHHRGISGPIDSDRQLGDVKAGDIIVAKGRKPKGAAMASTFQSDYRPIKYQPPPRAASRPERTPVPFRGRSEYQENFPVHTPRPTPPPPPRSPAPHVPFKATSEYQTNFPGHSVPAAAPPPRREPRPAVPFEGSSTYRQAFPAHDVRPAPAATPRTPGPKVPFNGSSTYHSDFPAHAVSPRAPAPSRPRTPQVPFSSTTEYQRNFLEQKVEAPKYVYIEPLLA